MFDIKTGYGMASAMAWVYFLIVMTFIGVVTLVLLPRQKQRGGY
jgi:ABC-type sugar transport system permease subunit